MMDRIDEFLHKNPDLEKHLTECIKSTMIITDKGSISSREQGVVITKSARFRIKRNEK